MTVPPYTHWSGKPVRPGKHNLLCVPQSIADGWNGFCSCGEWRCFKSFYEFSSRDSLLAQIDREFGDHVAAARAQALSDLAALDGETL